MMMFFPWMMEDEDKDWGGEVDICIVVAAAFEVGERVDAMTVEDVDMTVEDSVARRRFSSSSFSTFAYSSSVW